MNLTFGRKARPLRTILAIAVASLSLHARARSEVARRDERTIELELPNASLADVLSAMSRVTGRRYIAAGTVRDVRVGVTSSARLTAREAERALLATLNHQGFEIDRRGSDAVVVDLRGSVVASEPSADDRSVTWVHRVEHVPLEDAVNVLDALRSPEGRLERMPATRTLILVDTSAKVAELRPVLAAIDLPRPGARVWVEPVHWGDAPSMARMLSELFGLHEPIDPRAAPANDAGVYRIIAVPGVNMLVVLASERGYLRVAELMRRTDAAG
jgi:type II secretory pathway component GspD/PulD (secretin)